MLDRRKAWASPEKMFERYRKRDPFQSWDRDVLWDYCQFGLIESKDGLTLACPPEIEANIYALATAPESDIYDDIATVTIPVQVVRSAQEPGASFFQSSFTAPDLASAFAHGLDIAWPHVSHFIPMEDPAATAELIAKECATP